MFPWSDGSCLRSLSLPICVQDLRKIKSFWRDIPHKKHRIKQNTIKCLQESGASVSSTSANTLGEFEYLSDPVQNVCIYSVSPERNLGHESREHVPIRVSPVKVRLETLEIVTRRQHIAKQAEGAMNIRVDILTVNAR